MPATERATSRAGNFVEVNGATIYYETGGEGRPLVLLHPGLSSSASWASKLPRLVDDFLVITPDARGHGRSSNPGGSLSYPRLADDVAALIGELELERPIVGGYSDGGQVALELGARHPGAASALIVGAAYPDVHRSGTRAIFEQFLGVDDAGVPDLAKLDANLGDFASVLRDRHQGGERQWETLVEQSAPMWLDYRGLSGDEVRAIETPTLVLAGDRDEMFSLDLMVSLYRTLPKGELAIWPGSDHFALLAPGFADGFACLVRDFAGRHAERG